VQATAEGSITQVRPEGRPLDMRCFFCCSVARHSAGRAFRWFIVGSALACVTAAQQAPGTLHNSAGVVDAPRPLLSLTQMPESPPTPASPQDGPLYLTLQEAFRMALKNNLDIEFEQVDQTVADISVLLTEGGGLPRPSITWWQIRRRARQEWRCLCSASHPLACHH